MLIDPFVPSIVRQVSPVAGMNGFSPVSPSQECGELAALNTLQIYPQVGIGECRFHDWHWSGSVPLVSSLIISLLFNAKFSPPPLSQVAAATEWRSTPLASASPTLIPLSVDASKFS